MLGFSLKGLIQGSRDLFNYWKIWGVEVQKSHHHDFSLKYSVFFVSSQVHIHSLDWRNRAHQFELPGTICKSFWFEPNSISVIIEICVFLPFLLSFLFSLLPFLLPPSLSSFLLSCLQTQLPLFLLLIYPPDQKFCLNSEDLTHSFIKIILGSKLPSLFFLPWKTTNPCSMKSLSVPGTRYWFFLFHSQCCKTDYLYFTVLIVMR